MPESIDFIKIGTMINQQRICRRIIDAISEERDIAEIESFVYEELEKSEIFLDRWIENFAFQEQKIQLAMRKYIAKQFDLLSEEDKFILKTILNEAISMPDGSFKIPKLEMDL